MPSSTSRSRESCRPADVALVWTTRSQVPPRRRQPGRAARNRRREPWRPRGEPGSTSTRVTSTPGIRARSRATQQPTMPAPTTATRSPSSGPASQSALTAVSTVPPSTARAAWHPVRHRHHGVRRHDVRRLVRVEAEHDAVAQPGRSTLDDPDAQVAVLHRPREVPVLERRPHRGVLALGNAPVVHEHLGAPADAGAEGADQHVVGAGFGKGDRPDLSHARGTQPERLGLTCQPDHLPFPDSTRLASSTYTSLPTLDP